MMALSDGMFYAKIGEEYRPICTVTELNTTRDIGIDDLLEPVVILSNNEFSFQIDLTMKDRKTWAKVFMLPKYQATEFIFPKKKKRGTARRNRRLRRAKKGDKK